MRAEFLEVEVEPDSSFDDLLSNPVEAYQQVFGSVTREAGVADLDWKNHLFCQVSCLKSNMRPWRYYSPSYHQAIVVAELCAWGTGSDLFETLDLLIDTFLRQG